MSQGIGVVRLYVRDQDEAIEFYVGKLGFRVHTDARNGDYRWLTVQYPGNRLFNWVYLHRRYLSMGSWFSAQRNMLQISLTKRHSRNFWTANNRQI
ncbi:MAG: VOC family protein [Nitrosomonas sp.]|nr:VOC family protein [Nitrosomonas sp.]